MQTQISFTIRKIALSALLLFNGTFLFAQALTTSITDPNIGGTINILNPAKTANGAASTWRIYNMSGGYGNSLQFWAYDNISCGNGLCSNRFTLMDNGNVGIGTGNPQTKLDVNGIIQAYNLNNSLATWDNVRLWADGENTYLESNGDEKGMIIRSNGGNKILLMNNVGIGTTNPTEKLSVNGKIRAHEIKVETSNWPDYVFEQDYKILGLTALESYIKTNKHLPEMPSAASAERNGIELGEMNKLLLKKVEELTLMLIDMKKESDRKQSETNKKLTELTNKLYAK